MLSIESWSAVLLQALAGASVRALILVGIAAVGLWAWRGRTAPAQHAVWTVVAAAMLLLLLGPLLPPAVPLPADVDVARWLRAPAEPSAAQRTPLGAADLPVRAAPIVIAIDRRGGLWMDAVGPRVVWGWWSAAAGVYIVGLFVMLARLALGSFLAGRLVGRGTPVREERVAEAMDSVARAQALPMPWPQVLESAEIASPVVVGRQAPVILLPIGWREWDDWKLRAVLAHELAHVQRDDGRTVVLAAWNRAVFWFHPLAWWLQRRLAALCERACDDAAVRTVGDAPRYAQVLLEIAVAGPALRIPTAISMAGASQMGARIERLLQSERWSTGLTSPRGWLGIALAVLPVVAFLSMAQGHTSLADQRDVPRGWNWVQDGFRTSGEEARELERVVAREPEALGARAKLMAYYFYNADFAARDAHGLWVIANRPESELAVAGPTLSISQEGMRAPAEETRRSAERARQLWKEQVARHDGDMRVLEHAADTLIWTEPEAAERLWLRARELNQGDDLRWALRLAALYAEAVAVDHYTKAGLGSMGGRLRLPAGLGERVRQQLASGADLDMLGYVGTELVHRLILIRESKRGQEKELREARRQLGQYAEQLLVRASEKDPMPWAGHLRELREWLSKPGG